MCQLAHETGDKKPLQHSYFEAQQALVDLQVCYRSAYVVVACAASFPSFVLNSTSP
jgi:hypothetical protein